MVHALHVSDGGSQRRCRAADVPRRCCRPGVTSADGRAGSCLAVARYRRSPRRMGVKSMIEVPGKVCPESGVGHRSRRCARPGQCRHRRGRPGARYRDRGDTTGRRQDDENRKVTAPGRANPTPGRGARHGGHGYHEESNRFSGDFLERDLRIHLRHGAVIPGRSYSRRRSRGER